MNAPRTETIIRKRGEIRDQELYELARELEDGNSKLRAALQTLRDTTGLHNTPAITAFVNSILPNNKVSESAESGDRRQN